jgi:hypothetical protein
LFTSYNLEEYLGLYFAGLSMGPMSLFMTLRVCFVK